MKSILKYTFFFLTFSLFAACSKSDDDSCENSTDWLIPSCEVFDGGPGKDGIPSVDAPKFNIASSVNFLRPEDLVIGVYANGSYKAYPHPILDWHEIVNDEVGDKALAITYCPLTGTAIGWDRTIDGEVTTFGVSGLLYNTNLIPYDRKTDTNWSQILSQGVNGELTNRNIETHPVIETSWETWKALFPDSEVLNRNTGFDRDYNRYPYGDYRTNNNALIFPVSNEDSRLPQKDRGLGVLIDEKAKFYPVGKFNEGDFQVVSDEFQNTDLVVIGSASKNLVVAYERRLEDGTNLTFEALASEDNADMLMLDNEGNTWNIFGLAISGPRQGEQLKAPESFMGYWLAWATFYPNPEIF